MDSEDHARRAILWSRVAIGFAAVSVLLSVGGLIGLW